MAKYKNKDMGTIVEPSCEAAEQTFARSADWVKVVKEAPKPSEKSAKTNDEKTTDGKKTEDSDEEAK